MDLRRAALGFALAAAIGLAAFWTVRQLRNEPAINLEPYVVLGEVAADEVASRITSATSLVLLVSDPSHGSDNVLEGQIKAFRKSLRKHRHVSLDAVERIALDPMTRMATGGAIPPDQLGPLAARHPKAGAFVFFLPYPPGAGGLLRPAAARLPLIAVVAPTLPGYRQLLESGAIDLLITPRPDGDPAPVPSTAVAPSPRRAAFDRDYEILSATNARQARF